MTWPERAEGLFNNQKVEIVLTEDALIFPLISTALVVGNVHWSFTIVTFR